jgi:LmbE family N-acetylglucosaminyl deacetylase
VLGFNPYGGYGHPDHIYLHYATRAAFAAAGDPARYPQQIATGLAPWRPSKLYYPTFGARFAKTLVGTMRLLGRQNRRVGQNADVDLVRAFEENTPVTTTIDCADWLEPNLQARLCHRSQLGSSWPYERMPRALLRRLFGSESFTRVIPEWDDGSDHEHDLFDGIAESR